MTTQNAQDAVPAIPGNDEPAHSAQTDEVRASGASTGGELPGDRLLIVGIGASAGGLVALREFFQAAPSDANMAFVVVQHLSPDRESLLAELLARETRMEVEQIADATRVERGVVYVIPPGYGLVMRDGTLHLQQRDGPGERYLPIDAFLRSLADDRGEWSAAVILSGAGSDGTLGVRAIKGAGGLVIAQDPASAEQASMPRSAIGTGVIDYVLPPAAIPEALANYVDHFLQGERLVPQVMPYDDSRAIHNILTTLRTRTGHDFALYKRNTIIRRIQRRMIVRQLQTIGDYAAYLARNPDEVRALFKDLLIGVTEFFRDPEAFELLAENVIPELLQEHSAEGPLRAWVTACATGEEAYSIAILFREQIEALGQEVPVQIFATDIDERAIEVARRGHYPASISADVSPERLARFFQPDGDGYVMTDAVRKMIVFASQSLVKDPPFSHVHLITCRNLLIYLEPELQRSVLGTFEYALKPGGYLLLGTAEMLPEVAPYFELVDRRWKLFRRLEGKARPLVKPQSPRESGTRAALVDVTATPSQLHLRQQLERILLDHYQPVTLVVDADGRILFTYGQVAPFLQPASGETGGWHVMQMLEEWLRVPVATGIRHAVSENKVVRHSGLPLDAESSVDVVIRPIHRPGSLEGLLFVEFSERPSIEQRVKAPVDEDDIAPGGRVQELERELQTTKEYLQAVIEEMQSSNEEIRSTNEELQSANEELETSQEEAQSVNEELATLNNELESRIDELTWANNDMNNVLTSIDVGIILLDRRLQVRRFNQAATRIVNLIPGDVGRPLTHLLSNLVDGEWAGNARAVFETLTPHEEEVRSHDDRWYLMRIRPYRTDDDAIEGVVLTFSDITEQKEAERVALAAQAYAESIVHTVREPLVILNANLRVESANRAFYGTFGIDSTQAEGKLLYELGNRLWDIPRLRELLEEIIPDDEVFEGFVVEHEFEQIGYRRMLLNARRISAPGQKDLILLAIEEVSEPT
ncbi:MAG TPA: chemotaxis protein CheB [Anaerolineae bacterium]|nr:chemotaxis protein CheB [Anaerolineae bacterium]